MLNDVLHGLRENWKLKTEKTDYISRVSRVDFPGSERKPQNFNIFKGLFKGKKKFKGFSRVSRTGGHHAEWLKN